MDKIMRKKFDNEGQEKLESMLEVDWTRLPNDKIVGLFSCLNNRDRASLSSTCKPWWILSKSSYLWEVLDLRFNKCDDQAVASLASRCRNLSKLRIRGHESAASVINLKANKLREISIDSCSEITDVTLSALVAQHETLECLQLGLEFCENISSAAIKAIALCCPNLKKLWLSGIEEVSGEAIDALAENCPNLTNIGFTDCKEVDVAALGNVKTLVFLSVAGTIDINWTLALLHWRNLSNLVCLDVSRTDIELSVVSELLQPCFSLKVLCALVCPSLTHNPTFINRNGKWLVTLFTDILKELATLFIDMPKERGNVFLDCRKSNNFKDGKLGGVLDWLEWTVCISMLLVLIDEKYVVRDEFWLDQGTILLLSFLQSSHEEVQERAATALAFFDNEKIKAFIRVGGIPILVNLARSWQEGLQSESIQAIAALSINNNFVKGLLDEGGVNVLINTARSASKLVATNALLGIWNISANNTSAIAKADGIQALVDVIVKWSTSNDNEDILDTAIGSLANLALDEKCTMEVAWVGVAPALVNLLRTDISQRVQEQVASCLANMASHDNSNPAIVGQETGALEALVQLARSHHDGVREESARALLNLSNEECNREAIAVVGGVQALVALANSCANASRKVLEMAVAALWVLSTSEKTSIAVGQEGGVTALIALAKSDFEDIKALALGALWELAYNAGNAIRIIEEDGVPTLIDLCSSSVSKMSSLVSALTLAHIFDKRLDELVMIGTSSERTSKSTRLEIARRAASIAISVLLELNSDAMTCYEAAVSSLPAPETLEAVTELARIPDAASFRCSLSQIERVLTVLSHPSSIIKSLGAFVLLQFTIPGDTYAEHHANLLKMAGAPRVLHETATSPSTDEANEAKAFARVVLNNLEHHNVDDFN